jgi:hypothetical protein
MSRDDGGQDGQTVAPSRCHRPVPGNCEVSGKPTPGHRRPTGSAAQYEPGHRPRATPPPAPPRGQPRHEPEPAAAFRVLTSRAQLRHPRAAAIGDLHPDSASADRHRDRLPGKTRAAMPDAIPESSLASKTASSSQGCPGPRTAPAPANARTTRATSPATFTLSRTAAPVISAPPSRPPGKTRRGRTDAQGKYTLTSAATVKPDTCRWRLRRPGRGLARR